ncbi:MAG: lipid A export permease/ATP-binding protein MsbA [Gammaproteobacteria bacterium]|nr:lipid A export permease/ATP-binding protein MsbA [Gammaproteobacteria bacterium]
MTSQRQQGSGMQVYRRLLRYALPSWPVFVVAIIAMVFYAATDTGFAAFMQPLLDGSFVERDPKVIYWMPVVMLVLALTRGITGFVSSYLMTIVGRRVILKLRQEVFNHYLRLPTTYFDSHSAGEMLAKLTYNVEQVAESTSKAVITLIRDSLTIIGLVAWMLYLSPRLSLFVFIVGPLIGLLLRIVNSKFRRYGERIQDSMGNITQVADEVISGHRTVKLFSGEHYEQQRFAGANKSNFRHSLRFALVKAGGGAAVQFIAAFGLAAVIYVATSEILLETFTVGRFMSFLSAMLLIMTPLKRLIDVNSTMQRAVAAGNSLFSVLDVPSESDAGDPLTVSLRGQIEYRDVDFVYASRDEAALSNISLTIGAGEIVAFVGQSGSGKSTLVHLLPRFYEPTNGQILIDDHVLGYYKLADLRAQIALVSQDVILFNDTIANNIAYGALIDKSQSEICEAAKAAHALEFIEALPNKFETIVGDQGVLLSGGQKQRIAIARAILKDAPILILDEATSALDSQTEQQVKDALKVLMKDRTTLIVAHRLSTIEYADRIYVIEQGRIVETGNHQELLAKRGVYAALYQAQAVNNPPLAAA